MATRVWTVRELPRRRELHFGDRVIECFAQRPASVNAMLLDALARNPDGKIRKRALREQLT